MRRVLYALALAVGTLSCGILLIAPMALDYALTLRPEAVSGVTGIPQQRLDELAAQVLLVMVVVGVPLGLWVLRGMLNDQVRYAPARYGGEPVLRAHAQQGVVVVQTNIPRSYELAEIIGSGAKRVGTTPDGLAEYVVRPQRMSAETAARYITERSDMCLGERRVGVRWSVMPAHDGRPARAEMRVHVNRDGGRWPTIRDTDGGLGHHDL